MAEPLAEPRPHRVWSEHLEESEAGQVTAHTARGALMMALACEDDDGDFAPTPPLGDDQEHVEDWIVREPDGAAHRFRVGFIGPHHFGVTTLRSCRVCACTDDRACAPACGWYEENLCTVCATPEAEWAHG